MYDVIEFVDKYLKESKYYYKNNIYDPPVWEYLVDGKITKHLRDGEVPSFVFIYFTTRREDMGKDCKRYHMLVTGCMSFEIWSEDEGVTSIGTNYSIESVRSRYIARLKHHLKKLESI